MTYTFIKAYFTFIYNISFLRLIE